MSDFASTLKYLREQNNLSQRELASKLGMSPSAISMYESGNRQPRHEDEECIADFFNVNIDLLRGRTPENNETDLDPHSKRIIKLFMNAPPEIQGAIETILESYQHK